MEELRALLVEKWPDILSYLVMAIGYFLIFLFKRSTSKSVVTMKTTVKGNTSYVDTTVTDLRRDVAFDRNVMQAQLDEAKKLYAIAVSRCEELETRLANAEKALTIFINEETEVVENGEDSTRDEEVRGTEKLSVDSGTDAKTGEDRDTGARVDEPLETDGESTDGTA